jgi:hypothetical protein
VGGIAKVIGLFWLVVILTVGAIGLLGYARERLFGLAIAPLKPNSRARIRRIFDNIGYYLAVVAVIWIVIGGIIGWFVDPFSRSQPQEG